MATVCLALFIVLTAIKLVYAATRLRRGGPAALLVFGFGVTANQSQHDHPGFATTTSIA